MLYSGHATVRVLSFFGASPHRNSPGCGKDSEGGLIIMRTIHVSHCPQPKISTAGNIETNVLVETGELRCTYNSAVSWELWFYVLWIQSGLAQGHPFQTASSFVDSYSCWMWFVHGGMLTLPWIPWLLNFDTPQRLAFLVTDAPARRALKMCPLLNSDMSPIMLCALEYFMYSCTIALLI